MSKRLPYEEVLSRQLHEVPLPDENTAWNKMSQMLDNDDDDGVIIPPPTKGCGPRLIIAGLLLVGILWFFVRSDKWFNNSPKPSTENTKNTTVKTDSITRIGRQKENTVLPDKENISKNINDTIVNTISGDVNMSKNTISFPKKQSQNSIHRKETIPVRDNDQTAMDKENVIYNISGGANKRKSKAPSQIHTTTDSAGKKLTELVTLKKDTKGINETPSNPIPEIGQSKTTVDTSVKKSDTAIVSIKTQPDSLSKKPGDKKKIQPPAKYYFSAGVAIHQAIPFNGQKATPYNYYGRKGSLSDYIPSIYLRFNKEHKWFFQAEFRYGAPQYTKNIVYNKRILDTANGITQSSDAILQKTFYHQLPVSFNYLISPNWSMGGGVVLNKFSSAVSRQEQHVLFRSTGSDSILSTKIIKDRNDSFFVKYNFQWLIESQYQWKKFSLGFRYAAGLQPYIKFKDPISGLPRKEKSFSLNIFLRYELWKSKPK